MNDNDEFVRSEYTIDDLEQFRDENGFIDLTKAGINFTEQSREVVGNPDRIKNWVNFNGKKALIKGEAILDEERNYGIYAELIVEEIANQYGIETAHYDLVKMIGEDGKEIFGVLSESVVDIDKGEQLVSLRDIIGDEPVESGEFIDTTSYEYTIEELEKTLLLDGYSEKDIDILIVEYKKRLAFSMAVLDVDKHTENIAFIKKKENGRDIITLSPNFDSESALMLDNDYTTVQKLLDDYYGLKESADIAQPKIGTLRSVEQGGHNSLWKDTLEELYEDDDVLDYCDEVLIGTVNMDSVLENVEKKIKAELPQEIKYLAKYAYNLRNEEMSNVMTRGLGDISSENGFNINSLLQNIINMGLQDKIREGEQIEIGRQIITDIAKSSNKEKNVESMEGQEKFEDSQDFMSRE